MLVITVGLITAIALALCFYAGALYGAAQAAYTSEQVTLELGTKLDELGVRNPYTTAKEIVDELEEKFGG